MSCDVESDVKWRVVVQDWQQEDDSLRKFVKKKTSCAVELDVKWRVVVQSCEQDCDSLRKFVNKKTSFGVELDNSVKIWTYNSLRSSKVDDFGANRKGICDFLLVINSNFGPILHRFRDTAHYWLKIVYFSYPSLSSLWNFTVRLSVRKLVMELLCGECCVILTSTVFDWSTRVTDGQTDVGSVVGVWPRIYTDPVLCN